MWKRNERNDSSAKNRKKSYTYICICSHLCICVCVHMYIQHTHAHTLAQMKSNSSKNFFSIFFFSCGGTVDQAKHSNVIRTTHTHTHILANVHALSHTRIHTHTLASAKCKRNCVTQAPLCRLMCVCVCECGVRVVW